MKKIVKAPLDDKTIEQLLKRSTIITISLSQKLCKHELTLFNSRGIFHFISLLTREKTKKAS